MRKGIAPMFVSFRVGLMLAKLMFEMFEQHIAGYPRQSRKRKKNQLIA